jgi:hypothetical protein
MAVIWRHDANGSASTNLSATTPTVGGAPVFDAGAEAVVDGAGVCTPTANGNYSIPAFVDDFTFKGRIRGAQFFTNPVRIIWRCPFDTNVFGNVAYALSFNDFSTTLNERTGGFSGTGADLASAGAISKDVLTDFWMRVEGAVCQVWLGSNTGTPDLESSAITEYPDGWCGLMLDNLAHWDFLEIDDVPMSPGGPPPLQSPVDIFDTDLTAVELGGIALASEEIAAAGPTIYDIVAATALTLSGSTAAAISAALTSATQLQLTGATAAAGTPRVISATALSLTNAQPVLTGPAIRLATALSLAGATDVRQLARILSATQLQLTGEIPVLYIGGTPVYDIVSATQLVLTGAMPMRFDAAGALATSLALQGSTVASTASRIAAATALSFAQAAVVGLNPDVRLATALGLAGAAPMSLASAIAGGTALTLTGVATLQRLLPFGSATQLLLANAIPVVLDTGTPVYVITSTTQLQLTGGIGMVLAPRVASATSLALANAQPVVGGPAFSLVTALSLAGSILGRTDRAIAAGSVLGLEGQSLARLSTLVIRSATELRLSGQILIGIVTPTGIAWVTYRTVVAPAVASLIARAPAVRSASRTAPAVRLQRAVLPSLDEVP